MALQSGKNVRLAFKVQSAKDDPASGAGAEVLIFRPGQGFQLDAVDIQSQAVRPDGQTPMGRLGSQFGAATYISEVGVGGPLDTLMQAGLRGTWTAKATLTEASASLGAITISSNVITATGGSWITSGVRAGQMIRLSGHSTVANNDRWIRVLSVTAAAITTAGPLTDAGSEAEWSLEIARHLISANPPVERYYTFEERLQDINRSIVADNAKVGGLQFGVSADNLLTVQIPFGATNVRSESSAVFTDPVLTEVQPLVMLDGHLRVAGSDIVNFTSFDLNFALNPTGQPVAGTRTSPDVFLSNAVGTGSLSAILADLSHFDAYKAEDNIELFALAREKDGGENADFVSIYAGNAAFRGHQKPIGSDGGLIETMPISYGVDDRGDGFYPSMLVISTSHEPA